MHYANKKATMGIHETSEIKMAVNGNISLTDPDCRLMKNKNGMDTAYNVQSAVDTETHLMMNYQMTNRNTDHGLMASTMEEIKKGCGG